MLLTIRRVARFVLASVLWLHGLLLFEVAKPNLAPLAARLSLNINEVTIFCLIATLSILATYGVSNILVDMLYIYFFPFVLLYWTARLAYKLVRALNRVFAALSIDDVEPFDLHSIPGWPSPVTVPASTTGQQAGQQQAQPEPTKSAKSPSSYLRQLLTAPFVRFSLLWCLLLLLTTRPTLLWIALVVVLAHIGSSARQNCGSNHSDNQLAGAARRPNKGSSRALDFRDIGGERICPLRGTQSDGQEPYGSSIGIDFLSEPSASGPMGDLHWTHCICRCVPVLGPAVQLCVLWDCEAHPHCAHVE